MSWPAFAFGLMLDWRVATSQLFLPTPKVDSDQLPMAPDGGILDIHVTAFISSTDSLLAAGRAPAPSRVLVPMKSVVNAASAIIEDIRIFEQQQRTKSTSSSGRSDIDSENLIALRERTEATLSNLVAVSKTHATSMGTSPVSLLDAAASHLSAAITEVVKVCCVRKATKMEMDAFNGTENGSGVGRGGDETRYGGHARVGSAASSFLKRERERESTLSPSRGMNSSSVANAARMRRPPSPSSSNSSSPPPLFDKARQGNSDDSAVVEGPDDAWAELKVN